VTVNSASPPIAAAGHDVILVGGGLANCLIAQRLLEARPEVRLLVIERGATLGGNHTWSFHGGDVSGAAHARLKPFLTASWPRQAVHFPVLSRTLDLSYHTMSSDKLHCVLGPALGGRLMLATGVSAVEPGRVVLEDGREFAASCVIDGRGPGPELPLALGFQKFIGIEVETDPPHGETVPVIMDATVAQHDGYRFVYTLPYNERHMLIEDTYYSDGPVIDDDHVRQRVFDYAEKKGWKIVRIVREERGVLPIVLAGDIDGLCRGGVPGVPRVGLRAGLFHPTTGYSLPDAVTVADLIVGEPGLTSSRVRRLIEAHTRRIWSNRAFFRLLNRMLFLAATPDQRVGVFQHFYRLPPALIERFYAARLTLPDQARIMMGKPPVTIPKAIGAIGDAPAWAFARRINGVRT